MIWLIEDYMNTNLTVGRVGTTLQEVKASGLDYRADNLTITGVMDGLTPVTESHLEQMLAYSSAPDEGFVPVTWDVPDSTIDGFYRVRDADISAVTRQPTRAVYQWRMSLERVQGFAAPLFEANIMGGERAGSLAAADQAWHALPATVKGYEMGSLTPTMTTRASADGDLTVFTDATNSLYNARPIFYLPPADWYKGAATLLVDDRPVVGRQVRNRPENWQISNGVVRFTAGANGVITSQKWTGAAWGTAGSWRVVRFASIGVYPTLEAPHTLTVLRNSPEEVAIRLSYDAASNIAGSRFVVYVDISLRRGSYTATVRLHTRGSYRWGFYTPIIHAEMPDPVPAGYTYGTTGTPYAHNGGSGTGGYAAVEGLAWWMPSNATQDVTWGWGYYGASGGEDWAVVDNQHNAAQTERVQVVVR